MNLPFMQSIIPFIWEERISFPYEFNCLVLPSLQAIHFFLSNTHIWRLLSFRAIAQAPSTHIESYIVHMSQVNSCSCVSKCCYLAFMLSCIKVVTFLPYSVSFRLVYLNPFHHRHGLLRCHHHYMISFFVTIIAFQ